MPKKKEKKKEKPDKEREEILKIIESGELSEQEAAIKHGVYV